MINKAIAILLYFFTLSTHAAFITGQDLLNAFEAKIRIDKQKADAKDAIDASRAAGYIQGVIDSGVSSGIICTHKSGLTIRQAEKIITEYLTANPKMLPVPAVESVIISLHAKYRCD